MGAALLHATAAWADALAPGEWFAPADLAEYEALKNRARRMEWLAVRVALKQMLVEDAAAASPLHAHIRKNARGAPHLDIYDPASGRYARLACSLSHKGALAFAAYARAPGVRVGADIERRSWRLARLRRGFVHESDALMDGAEGSTGGLAVLWAFKEAATKLLGLGMEYGFSKIQCREAAAGVCELRDAGGNHYSGRYRWFGKYALALVVDQPAAPGAPRNEAPPHEYSLLERLSRARKLRDIRRARLAAQRVSALPPRAPEN